MTICGWCDEVMVPATASGMAAEATSHGLCRPCLEQALARARTQPVAGAPQFALSAPSPAPVFARA
jgi:hypothetical protein